MKKALLSVAMAAVISLSATAVSSTVVGAVSSNLATPKISKTENVNGGVKLTWSKVKGAETTSVLPAKTALILSEFFISLSLT